MSKKSSKQDEIGPWSEDKLLLLGKYLQAYSTIMNSQKQKGRIRKYHYIDAFAGAVVARAKNKNSDEEITRYIEGSPLRALQTNPPFDAYWFIDLSSGRSRKLSELQASYPERDIRVRKEDSNRILRSEVIPEVTKASRQRGVVFLDPYGLQVEWVTIKALAEAGAFDIFVNFPIMGITRLLPVEQQPDEHARNEINKIMGDCEWIDKIYRPTQQPDFWGLKTVERDVLPAAWLAALYAKRVGELFPFVSDPLIMYNSKNAALYSLFLASHKDVAAKIMNQTNDKHKRDTPQRGRATKLSSKVNTAPDVQSSFLD